MSVWNTMTDDQKVRAVHLDIMRHKEAALLAGVVLIGDIKFTNKMPTAFTDGCDVGYNSEFLRKLSRKELRWTALHENLHKAFQHCVLWKEALKQQPDIANAAMDFVVNAAIEKIDPTHDWCEFPSNKGALWLLDPKYEDWSFPKVFNDLRQKAKKQLQQPQNGQPGGTQKGQQPKNGSNGKQGPTTGDDLNFTAGGTSFDGHEPSDKTDGEARELAQQVEEALRQGQILSSRLRGTTGTGGPLDGAMVNRTTNWRDPLREFIEEAAEGDDLEQWQPIDNVIYGACMDIGETVVMPTFYSEAIGELCIFADTSGSMGGVYPVLFGEVAQIVRAVKPKRVVLLWWDTQVANVQYFEPKDYDQIATAMRPAGGGGTEPRVCIDWLEKHKEVKPCAIVWLTDGYIGEEPRTKYKSLWGIVDNDSWTSKYGKTLHLDSMIK